MTNAERKPTAVKGLTALPCVCGLAGRGGWGGEFLHDAELASGFRWSEAVLEHATLFEDPGFAPRFAVTVKDGAGLLNRRRSDSNNTSTSSKPRPRRQMRMRSATPERGPAASWVRTVDGEMPARAATSSWARPRCLRRAMSKRARMALDFRTYRCNSAGVNRGREAGVVSRWIADATEFI